MMTAISFKNLNSSAISSVKVEGDEVFITFQGKNPKEYVYNCENVDEFVKNIKKVVNDPEKSLGRYINQQIKDKAITIKDIWPLLNIAQSILNHV